MTALQAKSGDINDTALNILRELHTELDVHQLAEQLEARLRALKDDGSQYSIGYLRFAIPALSYCGPYAPVDLLIPFLDNTELRDETLEALVRLHQFVPCEIFLALLSDRDSSIHDAAMIGLGKQKERVPLEALLRLFFLHSEQRNADLENDELTAYEESIDHHGVTHTIIETLIELDEYASLEKITAFLSHVDKSVREGARRVLAELEASKPQDYFIREWDGEFDATKIRPAILKAQIALGEDAAFETWIELLDDNHFPAIREGAASILDELARVVPTKILELALACDRPGLRMARLRAWSVLGQGNEIIAAAWSDKQPSVRQKAMELLGDLDYPGACEALANLLRDENDSSLLSTLLQALSKKGKTVPLEPLLECCGYRGREWWRWGHFEWEPALEAAQILREAYPERFRALVPLAEAILHGELPAGPFASRTQSRLADAIGAIGRSEPRLLAILTDLLDWPYWQVRMEAAQACGKIQRNIPDAAIQRLLLLRNDPQSRAVRDAADDALARILALANSLEDG